MMSPDIYIGEELSPESGFLLTLAKARERFAEALEEQRDNPGLRYVLSDSIPGLPRDLATFGLAQKGVKRVIGGENDLIELSLPISGYEGREPVLSRDPADEAMVITHADEDGVVSTTIITEENFGQVFPERYGMAVTDFYQILQDYQVVALRSIS